MHATHHWTESHLLICKPCQADFIEDMTGARPRGAILVTRRPSPVPPILPVDHSWQELFGVNWVQPMTVHNFPWAQKEAS